MALCSSLHSGSSCGEGTIKGAMKNDLNVFWQVAFSWLLREENLSRLRLQVMFLKGSIFSSGGIFCAGGEEPYRSALRTGAGPKFTLHLAFIGIYKHFLRIYQSNSKIFSERRGCNGCGCRYQPASCYVVMPWRLKVSRRSESNSICISWKKRCFPETLSCLPVEISSGSGASG